MDQLGQPLNVIIDTDMGWDAVLAILLLVKNTSLNILGITITGCGATHLEHGCYLARGLLEIANLDAPVCAGADTPRANDNQFPPLFRRNMDHLGGLRATLPAPRRPLDVRRAWDFMADGLAAEEDPITILSLGGLTNIARLVNMSPPACLENIQRLVVLGGAVATDGNVARLNNAIPAHHQGPEYASNITAEWNIFLDALSAKQVFDTRIPITLVPLDACEFVLLTPDLASSITAKDPVATLAKRLLRAKFDPKSPLFEPDPQPVLDPLAAMIMTGLVDAGERRDLELDVETVQTRDDNSCGRTFQVWNSGRRPIEVIDSVFARDFLLAFQQSINAPLRPRAGAVIRENVSLSTGMHP